MKPNPPQKLHPMNKNPNKQKNIINPFGITKKAAYCGVSCINLTIPAHDNNQNLWSYSTKTYENSTITPPIYKKYV